MKPSELFDTAARERIEQAVRDAEAGTSGEIVVSVAHACDRYAVAPWKLGVGLAALAALAIALLESGGFVWADWLGWLPLPQWGPSPLWILLAAQLIALVLGHWLCRIEAVRRFFVSEAELETRAREQALRAFAEHGVRKTEERTGILIFIALFEHRVVVLGDEAVDAALEPGESWSGVVDLVLAGIRGGDVTGGIVAAVRRCGEILSHPLPPRDDDIDEIPHGLVLED